MAETQDEDRTTVDLALDEPSREQLVAQIAGTYREMPDLCLDLAQAARLFGLGLNTCQLVLDHLVSCGTLRKIEGGLYKTT